MSRAEADYLVVGAGAAGMAFTDALITACDASVVIVDERHAPGGHWNDAYPFVRLHQPSAYYGVNSLPLGSERIDRHGPNEGYYEQAGAAEICAYYERVMREKLLPSGRVRYFPMSRYSEAPHRISSLLSGETHEVEVRKKLVDARYLEASVPTRSTPPFEVADGARCVPVNELTRLGEPAEKYVIVGAGKTAMDACGWLLKSGVAPSDIRWIKPREAWLQNRTYAQGGELVGTLFEGIARQLEASAAASSLEDLFQRLEAAEQFVRVDQRVAPTMYRGPTLSVRELQELRRVENVVRLGKVRRIERDRIVLEQGTVPTSPKHLHVHCASRGLSSARAVPIFAGDRITLQSIRIGLLPFAAAVTAYVEATRTEREEKNRLCPSQPQPDSPLDWVRGTLVAMRAASLWQKEPDIAEWLEGARLNAARGIRGQ
ncbi:MAG TPA: NAD(P)-binding protein, partial [Myxococcota bacterium]|nr:NAD(P)-binding protein [Myxococcota bacterium]